MIYENKLEYIKKLINLVDSTRKITFLVLPLSVYRLLNENNLEGIGVSGITFLSGYLSCHIIGDCDCTKPYVNYR